VTAPEPTMVVSIGTVVGGMTPANKPWREALDQLGRAVSEARTGLQSELNVNVVFQVPGNFLQPDFEGVRTGSYRKADNLLMVQVAIPEGGPGEDYFGWVVAAMRDAIAAAESWARRRKVASELPALRALVDALMD